MAGEKPTTSGVGHLRLEMVVGGWGKDNPRSLRSVDGLLLTFCGEGNGEVTPICIFRVFCTGVHCLELRGSDLGGAKRQGSDDWWKEGGRWPGKSVKRFAVSGNGAVTPIVLLYLCVYSKRRLLLFS